MKGLGLNGFKTPVCTSSCINLIDSDSGLRHTSTFPVYFFLFFWISVFGTCPQLTLFWNCHSILRFLLLFVPHNSLSWVSKWFHYTYSLSSTESLDFFPTFSTIDVVVTPNIFSLQRRAMVVNFVTPHHLRTINVQDLYFVTTQTHVT